MVSFTKKLLLSKKRLATLLSFKFAEFYAYL